MEKIGLIPAAGSAKRIAPLPCSKEIYPIGFRYGENDGTIRPMVACHSLLENMAMAGAEKAYVILRPEKWDIPFYLRSGKFFGLKLAYMVIDKTSGTPYTIDHAFTFIENALILFGFPDIVFSPKDAFIKLVKRQQDSGADVVLGLYRATNPHKMDMINLNASGQVTNIIIKPRFTDLEYTWIIAVWTSTFTRFMHLFLSNTPDFKNDNNSELYLGDIICAGLKEGIRVETVIFEDGAYVDIGTPQDLIRAVKQNIKALETNK